MSPKTRRRRSVPTLCRLESRLVLSALPAAPIALTEVHTLTQPKPTLAGTINGTNLKEQVPAYVVGLIRSTTLKHFGKVGGLIVSSNRKVGATTLNQHVITLSTADHKSRLVLNSSQTIPDYAQGLSQVTITYKVTTATGAFAPLAHRGVKGTIQTNFSAPPDTFGRSSSYSLTFA
jgi:hypothetical protein